MGGGGGEGGKEEPSDKEVVRLRTKSICMYYASISSLVLQGSIFNTT